MPQNFSLKIFLYFFLKILALKKFLVFSQKNAFLIFREMELSNPKNKKFQEGSSLFLYFNRKLVKFEKQNFFEKISFLFLAFQDDQ